MHILTEGDIVSIQVQFYTIYILHFTLVSIVTDGYYFPYTDSANDLVRLLITYLVYSKNYLV